MPTIDWIILFIIAIYALFGLRRGFIATLVATFGSILSLLIALAAASYCKQPVGAMLAPYMKGSIMENLPDLTAAVNSIDDAWNHISGYLQSVLSSYGVSLNMIKSSSKPLDDLADAISQSMGETVAYIFIFVAVFLLVRWFIHIIARALNIVARLPVIHSFNALLGGITGACTGLLLCTCILWALKLFVPAVYSDVGLLPPSEMKHSSVARYLVGWNDGVSLFESIPADS